jgi:hypothetical protein
MVAHCKCVGVDFVVDIRRGYSQLRQRVPYTMYFLWIWPLEFTHSLNAYHTHKGIRMYCIIDQNTCQNILIKMHLKILQSSRQQLYYCMCSYITVCK